MARTHNDDEDDEDDEDDQYAPDITSQAPTSNGRNVTNENQDDLCINDEKDFSGIEPHIPDSDEVDPNSSRTISELNVGETRPDRTTGSAMKKSTTTTPASTGRIEQEGPPEIEISNRAR